MTACMLVFAWLLVPSVGTSTSDLDGTCVGDHCMDVDILMQTRFGVKEEQYDGVPVKQVADAPTVKKASTATNASLVLQGKGNCNPTYYDTNMKSQAGQDAILNDVIFQDATGKTFLEMGMMAGVVDSNSYFFEQSLCWTGLCVEPLPEMAQKLEYNRPRCNNVNGAVCDRNGKRTFVDIIGGRAWSGFKDTLPDNVLQQARMNGWKISETEVMCHTLPSLLEANKMSHLDYWSLDVEGAELEVLNSIDFNTVSIDVIDVEVNGGGPSVKTGEKRIKINELLVSKGYTRILSIELFVPKKHCRFILDDVYVLPHVKYDLSKIPAWYTERRSSYQPC